MEFNSLFPTAAVDKVFGRDVVNKNWKLLDGSDFFTTPYQLAAQLGLYYEDETMMYPRFDKRINLKEGSEYLKQWGRNYYAPNPYTRSMRLTEKPVVINNFLVNWAIERGESALFSEALAAMFKETIGNTDILINMINNFSEVTVVDDIVILKDKDSAKLYPLDKVWLDVSPEDKKAFFYSICPTSASTSETFSSAILVRDLTADLRKKFFVNYLKEFALKSDGNHISDSSISTYKGMFDRSLAKGIVKDLFPQFDSYYDLVSLDEIDKTRTHKDYKEINSTQNNALSATIKHYVSFLDCKIENDILKLDSVDFSVLQTPPFVPNQPLQQIFYGAPGTGKSHTIKKVTADVSEQFVIRTTFHPDSDYSTFVGAYKPTMQKQPVFNQQTGVQMGEEKKIVYSYIPQAFLKAYTTAWMNPTQAVYLIIEEINRGNCAQIFGDIFQLLDREDNGKSSYSIKPDQDMQMYLEETFEGSGIEERIAKGKVLELPSNLHIWATMNTSDQSLFPIDSAFKRRWEWKYVPISQGRDKETGDVLEWYIKVGNVKYNWWTFIQKINEKIDVITSSEDKKLGFFFCKAKDGIIEKDTFVSKVLFYLWNDVFKDYGFDDELFQITEGEGKKNLSFDKFYMLADDGEVIVSEDYVKAFLKNLKVDEAMVEDDGSMSTSSNNEKITAPSLYKTFWTNFLSYAKNIDGYKDYFNGRNTPSSDCWYSYELGNGQAVCLTLKMTNKEVGVKLLVRDAVLFETLRNNAENIKQDLETSYELTWKDDVKNKEVGLIWQEDNYENIADNEELFAEMIDKMLKMRNVCFKYFGS